MDINTEICIISKIKIHEYKFIYYIIINYIN